jgi:hypothetical protein
VLPDCPRCLLCRQLLLFHRLLLHHLLCHCHLLLQHLLCLPLSLADTHCANPTGASKLTASMLMRAA